jgi:hypothetical protein
MKPQMLEEHLVHMQRALDEAQNVGVRHFHLTRLSEGRDPVTAERVGDLILFHLQPEPGRG